MKTILSGTSRLVGSIFHEVDVNFIEVCNSIFRIAYPEKILQNLAADNFLPDDPVKDNCYLVPETGTIWDLEVEKDQIICWNGTDWEILPHKITEINAAIQSFFFKADVISLAPVTGLNATDIQTAIAEISAVLVSEGFIVP